MTSVATRLTLLSSRPGDRAAAQPGTSGGSCSAALAEQPWDFPAPLTKGYGPGASQHDVVP
ncbi:MAG TPA: quinolinate synthase, partial [Kocuria sp.]|nr:quinolinate synthase [Kocuria sp.]